MQSWVQAKFDGKAVCVFLKQGHTSPFSVAWYCIELVLQRHTVLSVQLMPSEQRIAKGNEIDPILTCNVGEITEMLE